MSKWEGLTQKQWREQLRELLQTNDEALRRSIVVIYRQQIPQERVLGEAIIEDKVGFTAFDAEILGSFAKQIEHGNKLSDKQMAIARNKMPKYWRQLMNISKRKMANK